MQSDHHMARMVSRPPAKHYRIAEHLAARTEALAAQVGAAMDPMGLNANERDLLGLAAVTAQLAQVHATLATVEEPVRLDFALPVVMPRDEP